MRHQSPPSFTFQPVLTRLCGQLVAHSDWAKVLAVIAPVGYGKTVLLAQLHAHLASEGEDAVWISVDERMSRTEQLIGVLLHELQASRAALDPAQALLSGNKPLDQSIDAVLDALERRPRRVTVFLDNLDGCVDPGLGSLLQALVFRSSPHARFVWSSTSEVPADLARAQLEGLARRIGFSDLSMDARETGELLGSDLAGRIGQSGVDAVQIRTEGWPAAVRLAHLVLVASEHPETSLHAFSGSDEDLAAMLNKALLKGFSPGLHDFLLCLSLLRTFGLALCRHAIDAADAQEHLEFLQQRNVFIVPLDRNRQRYRLHGLFREYLSGQAALHVSPLRREEVWRRASEWCERAGDWHDAIEYAMAAGDLQRASRLLESSARHFVRENGDIPQFVTWVDTLRNAKAEVGWDTHYWYVWAFVFQRRYERALQQHARLVERFDAQSDAPGRPADLKQRVQHLRICIDYFSDRLNDAERGVEAWVSEHRATSPYGVASVGCIKSLCLASNFHFEQAWKTMRATQPVLLEIDGADMVGWISLIHSVLMAYEGDFARAQAEVLSGLQGAQQRLGEGAVLCGMMSAVAALCAVNLGQFPQARALLQPALRTAASNLDLMACALEAALALWTGEDDELISLDHLRRVAAPYPPRLSAMFSCYLVRRLLELGRPADAAAEGERIGLPADWSTDNPAAQAIVPRLRDLYAMASIELLLAAGRHKRADELATREYRTAKDEGRAARLVEIGLLRAAIAHQQEDDSAASRAMAGALSRAARRGIVRPFEMHAQLLAGLMNAGKISAWSFALAEERTFFQALCTKLGIGEASASPAKDTPPAAETPAAAPTAREAELLRLLEMGLSNQEIADRTEVSVSTIKWHLKNLYRKFGVSSRTAVIARARSLSPAPAPTPANGTAAARRTSNQV
ncbi:hypothetical protein J7E70_15685 [Variovorax paradoxus]|nr:LuxR C-terminal-related transcriptional regulator [Variovorax paradoxus]MBT2301903.1 hypothetical protein [Variovorax paradoxus]